MPCQNFNRLRYNLRPAVFTATVGGAFSVYLAAAARGISASLLGRMGRGCFGGRSRPWGYFSEYYDHYASIHSANLPLSISSI